MFGSLWRVFAKQTEKMTTKLTSDRDQPGTINLRNGEVVNQNLNRFEGLIYQGKTI